LREIVTEEDAQAAIDLMNYFLQSVGIDMETKRIDIDVIMTGQSKSQREKILTILDIVDTMVKEAGGKAVPKETVIQKAVEMGIDEHFARRVIDRLIDNGELMQPSPGHIKRA
ncbi:MAG: Minichromosome maintenance protein MCM, partial [Thermoprotei archaeon]